MNRVLLTGKITNEVEVKPIGQSGGALCKLNLCVRREYVNPKTKAAATETLYINVDCWGQIAEACRGMRNGDMIEVDGRLRLNSWVNKAGVEQKTIGVHAEAIALIQTDKQEEISEGMNRKMEIILDELPF